ncbi:MAG: ThuA domain-containing protein [Sediminicola sp.]
MDLNLFAPLSLPDKGRRYFTLFVLTICMAFSCRAMKTCDFKVVAFYTAKNDMAHISFVKEADHRFADMAKKNGFCYRSTDDWQNMNSKFLSEYQVVLFLDTRPEDKNQRAAFQEYMDNGGAWMGFHFAGFALTPSDFPNDWDWYQNRFLGCGAYNGNTWRPTAATLKVERPDHPVTKNLPQKITSTPNEWYKWEKDLRNNPDIQILLSIDPESFPLGTGPKAHEIWYKGDYPVVWTNKNYRMLYINMGHNDMDYENGTNKELSSSFDSPMQNKMLMNGLLWLGGDRDE